jgi:hypothetical protein
MIRLRTARGKAGGTLDHVVAVLVATDDFRTDPAARRAFERATDLLKSVGFELWRAEPERNENPRRRWRHNQNGASK